MAAPSACNQQPWYYIVVKNKDTFSKIIEAHPYTNMLPKASIAIIYARTRSFKPALATGFRTAPLPPRTCYWLHMLWATGQPGAEFTPSTIGCGRSGSYLGSPSKFTRYVLSLLGFLMRRSHLLIGISRNVCTLRDGDSWKGIMP